MKDFLTNNWQYITPLLTLLLGWLIPNNKMYELGVLTRKKLPRDVTKLILSKVDPYFKGLRERDVEGNKNLIHNDHLQEDKFKIDLGLKD